MIDENHEPEPEMRLPPARTVGAAALCLWALLCVVWFTSERANTPLPSLAIYLLQGRAEVPEGTNFFDLYTLDHPLGAHSSLLRTYGSLVSPSVWRRAEIGWANIDWLGHAEALGAIVIFTLVGWAIIVFPPRKAYIAHGIRSTLSCFGLNVRLSV